jgi:hypothetical protein
VPATVGRHDAGTLAQIFVVGCAGADAAERSSARRSTESLLGLHRRHVLHLASHHTTPLNSPTRPALVWSKRCSVVAEANIRPPQRACYCTTFHAQPTSIGIPSCACAEDAPLRHRCEIRPSDGLLYLHELGPIYLA